MREILFQGRRLDNGEWISGAYYLQREFYGEDNVKHYIITSSDSLDHDQALEYAEVDPDTIGQFTGHFDKHDKRIFEGHILLIIRNGRKYVCAVKDIRNLPDFMFGSSVESIEIVSDIYDPMWQEEGEDDGKERTE